MKLESFLMKRIILTAILLLCTCIVAEAQWARYGFRVGAGASHIFDDISSVSPVFGAGAGIFVDYGFENAKIAWNTNLYLELGVNFRRSGGNLQELINVDNNLTIRESYYHTYYAQIPIMLGFKYEIPVRRAGHYINVLFGPAFSAGIWGTYRDRKVSPYNPHANANYDNYAVDDNEARSAFKYIRRFDADAIIMVGYHYRQFMLDLVFDFGFVPVGPEDDALRIIEQQVTGDEKMKITVPGGNNMTYMLSFGYYIPIHEKARYRGRR